MESATTGLYGAPGGRFRYVAGRRTLCIMPVSNSPKIVLDFKKFYGIMRAVIDTTEKEVRDGRF